MTARRSVLIQFVALAVAVAMSFCAIPFLRYSVPTWSDDGRVVGGWSGDPAMILGPLLLVGVLGLTFAFIRGRSVPPAGLFAALALSSALFFGQHVALLGFSLLKGLFPLRMVFAMGFGLLFGLAPIVARVEQNPWFGVRTPWTLGSRRVWKETHRATGRLWLVGGALGSLVTILGAPILWVVLMLAALVLAPAAISYRVWRRLGRP